MAEFSKEWLIQNNDTRKPDFSIEKEFNKLKEGQSIGIICEGYGITSILNHKSTCYVFKDGNKIKFSKISEYKFKQKRKTISLRNLFLIIIGLWISMGVVLYLIPKSNEIGDMFGTVNTLFSGLALAGIIFTIFLQKKELKLQRKELSLTRNEFITQNEIMQLQKFENTFFNLIRNHAHLVESITVIKSNEKLEGYMALEYKLQMLITRLENLVVIIQKSEINFELTENDLPKNIFKFYSDLHHLVDDTILILDYKNKYAIENKEMYNKLVYNSMSKSEKILFGLYQEFISENTIDNLFKSDFKKISCDLLKKDMQYPPLISAEIYPISCSISDLKKNMKDLFLRITNNDERKITVEKIEIFGYLDNSSKIISSNFILNSKGNSYPIGDIFTEKEFKAYDYMYEDRTDNRYPISIKISISLDSKTYTLKTNFTFKVKNVLSADRIVNISRIDDFNL